MLLLYCINPADSTVVVVGWRGDCSQPHCGITCAVAGIVLDNVAVVGGVLGHASRARPTMASACRNGGDGGGGGGSVGNGATAIAADASASLSHIPVRVVFVDNKPLNLIRDDRFALGMFEARGGNINNEHVILEPTLNERYGTVG